MMKGVLPGHPSALGLGESKKEAGEEGSRLRPYAGPEGKGHSQPHGTRPRSPCSIAIHVRALPTHRTWAPKRAGYQTNALRPSNRRRAFWELRPATICLGAA